MEMDCAALLAEGKCRHPDGDQAVLAERQAEVGVRDNLKDEIPVPALVNELAFGKRA